MSTVSEIVKPLHPFVFIRVHSWLNLLTLWYLQAFWPSQPIGTDHDWVTVAAGGQHVLALKADRSLWAWGNDSGGELGFGNADFNQYTPARVSTDSDWAAIAAGAGTSLARKGDGSLWAWGIGISNAPTPVLIGRVWRDFAASGVPNNGRDVNFATAIAADGSLWTQPFSGRGLLESWFRPESAPMRIGWRLQREALTAWR